MLRLGDGPAADVTRLAILDEGLDVLLDQLRVPRVGERREGEPRHAEADGEIRAAPAHLLQQEVRLEGAEPHAAHLRREARGVVAQLVGAAENAPQLRVLRDDLLGVGHQVEFPCGGTQHQLRELVHRLAQRDLLLGQVHVEFEIELHDLLSCVAALSRSQVVGVTPSRFRSDFCTRCVSVFGSDSRKST